MKTVIVLLSIVFAVIKLPFVLLDYFVFSLPRELRAKKARKTIAVGQRWYFFNVLGTMTECTVKRIKDGKALMVNSSRSGWEDISDIYPV